MYHILCIYSYIYLLRWGFEHFARRDSLIIRFIYIFYIYVFLEDYKFIKTNIPAQVFFHVFPKFLRTSIS